MPLVIGIKDSEKADEMFTKEEQGFLAGVSFGMLCMAGGIGSIEGKYGYHISVDEAVERFTVMNRYYKYNSGEGEFAWLEDREFVQRMADAEWGCNVNNHSKEEFIYNMKSNVYDQLTRDLKLQHLTQGWENWDVVQKKRDHVKHVVYYHLTGDEWLSDCIDELIYVHQEELLGKEIFDKYLHWDEDTQKYVLVDELPEGF